MLAVGSWLRLAVLVLLAAAVACVWYLHRRNETLAILAATEANRAQRAQEALATLNRAHRASLDAIASANAKAAQDASQLKALRGAIANLRDPNACAPSAALSRALDGLRKQLPALDATGDRPAPGTAAGVR